MTSELPPPPAKLQAPIDEPLRRSLLAAMADAKPNPHAAAWLEKVRRFASLHNRNLRRIARARFGLDWQSQLEWMTRLLLAGASRNSDVGGAPVDPTHLSAALFSLAAMRNSPDLRMAANSAVQVLAESLRAGPFVPPPAALGPVCDFDTTRWEDEVGTCPGLILFSPNPFSLYSLAVLQLCLQMKMPVRGIVLRSFSRKRLQQEWRRDGARLPRKIWRKLVLRADENPVVGGISMKQMINRLNPQRRDLRKLAADYRIPVHTVDAFSDCSMLLDQLGGELGLFTGGGMVDRVTIEGLSQGIINVHLGQLPHYKGMDVVEAPLAECCNTVGATAHLMVHKVDAGPVIQRVDFPADAYRDLATLRNSLGCALPFMLVDSALGLGSGRLMPLGQPSSGRQYFVMHPQLRELLDQRLAKHGAKHPPKVQEQIERAIDSVCSG